MTYVWIIEYKTPKLIDWKVFGNKQYVSRLQANVARKRLLEKGIKFRVRKYVPA